MFAGSIKERRRDKLEIGRAPLLHPPSREYNELPKGRISPRALSSKSTDPNPIQETNALEAIAWKSCSDVKNRGCQRCGHGSSITRCSSTAAMPG